MLEQFENGKIYFDAPKPVPLLINYCSIIRELDKRLGKCPDNVKDALIDMQVEQEKKSECLFS